MDHLARQNALDIVFARVPEAVVFIDPEDRILEFNPEFTRIFGYTPEEACGRLIDELIVPEERTAEAKELTDRGHRGDSVDLETVRRRKDGTRVQVSMVCGPVSVAGSRIAQYIIYRDITDRKRAEQSARENELRFNEMRLQLAHANRVASIGELSAAIAHELKQPLSGIVTNASTSLRRLSADPPNVEGAAETVRRAIRDANRASDVISRLRSMLTKRDLQVEVVELDVATHEVLELLKMDLHRSGAILKTEFANGLQPVLGDRIQLQQVILNLLRNALDAMSDTEEGKRQLVIKIEPKGGESMCLSVQDTGVGFDAQQARKLFEPFYTTKISGMGIGLSVSRSIIELHRGRLWATSNDTSGATFSFSIPIAVPT